MMNALPSPLDLAHFQFAFVVVWHFLFPAFAIGLANFLVGLEKLWSWAKQSTSVEVFSCLRKASTVLPAGRSSHFNPRNLTNDTYAWWLP
jgi:hypothetical protein